MSLPICPLSARLGPPFFLLRLPASTSCRVLYSKDRRLHRRRLTQHHQPAESLGGQPIFSSQPDGSVGFVEVDRSQHAQQLRKEALRKRRSPFRLNQTQTIHHPDLELDEAMSAEVPNDDAQAQGDETIFSPINTHAIPCDLQARQGIAESQTLAAKIPEHITELPRWNGGNGTGRASIPAYPFKAKTALPAPSGSPIGDLNLYNGSLIQSGFKISKGEGKVHTRRKWHPNVHLHVLKSKILGQRVPVRTTSRILRTIRKEGGLDEYLISDSRDRLKEMGEWGWRIRWLMLMRNRTEVARTLIKKKQRFYTARLKAADKAQRLALRKKDKTAREEVGTGRVTYTI